MTKIPTKDTRRRLMRREMMSMLTSLGLLAIAVAIVIPLLRGGFEHAGVFRWIYAGGALLALLAALFTPPLPSADLRERRWQRIEAWSAIFFCAGAAFLFIPGAAPRDWLAFTLAGAALRIISFARLAFRKKKPSAK